MNDHNPEQVLQRSLAHLNRWREFINGVCAAAQSGKEIKWEAEEDGSCDEHIHLNFKQIDLGADEKHFLHVLERIRKIKQEITDKE